MANIGELLQTQEDRGVAATLEALKRLGVLTYNHETQSYAFAGQRVSGERLDQEVQRALRRA